MIKLSEWMNGVYWAMLGPSLGDPVTRAWRRNRFVSKPNYFCTWNVGLTNTDKYIFVNCFTKSLFDYPKFVVAFFLNNEQIPGKNYFIT